MLVSQQRAVTLEESTKDGGDSRNLMNSDQKNPPKIVRNASWLLHIKVSTYIEPMLVKPCVNLNHVQPASVVNEKAMALFVRDEVLLLRKIRHEQCKR